MISRIYHGTDLYRKLVLWASGHNDYELEEKHILRVDEEQILYTYFMIRFKSHRELYSRFLHLRGLNPRENK